MSATASGAPSPGFDPLPVAAVGSGLAGAASLVWPELLAGAVTLAVLTGFVVWVRAVRTLRDRRTTGYPPARLIPLLALGAAGWATELLLGPTLPTARAPLLGVVGVGLWLLSGRSGAGL